MLALTCGSYSAAGHIVFALNKSCLSPALNDFGQLQSFLICKYTVSRSWLLSHLYASLILCAHVPSLHMFVMMYRSVPLCLCIVFCPWHAVIASSNYSQTLDGDANTCMYPPVHAYNFRSQPRSMQLPCDQCPSTFTHHTPSHSSFGAAVCTTVDICPAKQLPDGTQQQPAACASDSMMPTTYEIAHGKTFSCMCGGLAGDASTEWACKQQPLTYWVFSMLPQNDSNTSVTANSPHTSTHNSMGVQTSSGSEFDSDSLGRFLTAASAAAVQDTKVDFHVVERGGTMSIDLNPHDFQYAYAGVWEGNFTGCTFSTGACTRPMQGDDCFVATCEGAGVVCPPPCKPSSSCPGVTTFLPCFFSIVTLLRLHVCVVAVLGNSACRCQQHAVWQIMAMISQPTLACNHSK